VTMASMKLGCTIIVVISTKFHGRAAPHHCIADLPSTVFHAFSTFVFLGSIGYTVFCRRAANNKLSVPGGDQSSDPTP